MTRGDPSEGEGKSKKKTERARVYKKDNKKKEAPSHMQQHKSVWGAIHKAKMEKKNTHTVLPGNRLVKTPKKNASEYLTREDH